MQTFSTRTKQSSVVFINGKGLLLSALQSLAQDHSLSLEIKSYSSEAIQREKTSHKNIYVVELCDNLSVPFSINETSGIWICENMMKNLCQYLKIEQESYLLLMILLAMTQINALKNNELLKSEYLIHDSNCSCLFSYFTDFTKWFMSFEELFICKGSVEFYNCLGNEFEIQCLQKLIQHMNKAIR
jgi:hypothetical protein